jgi:hypothetical protein
LPGIWLGDKKIKVEPIRPEGSGRWANNSMPVENLPKEMRMSADAMVDAALSDFDQGEFVTTPSLPDRAQWEAFDQACQALIQSLSRSAPAPRYRVTAANCRRSGISSRTVRKLGPATSRRRASLRPNITE